jgi:hypothetical protein
VGSPSIILLETQPDLNNGSLAGPHGKRVRKRQAGKAGAGWTVRDVALRYRVSEAKVLGWIARRELPAINVADRLCSRPRWVITPEDLEAFERRRQAGPAPEARRRPRKRAEQIDFFPGD